jgi:hypothetical protein
MDDHGPLLRIRSGAVASDSSTSDSYDNGLAEAFELAVQGGLDPADEGAAVGGVSHT